MAAYLLRNRQWLPALMASAILSCSLNPPPPPVPLSQYEIAYVRIAATDQFEEKDLLLLQTSTIDALKNRKLFKTVKVSTPDHPPSDGLSIVIEVESIRRVSDSLRVSLGRTAPSNTASAIYTLVDNGSDKELTRFKLFAHSPLRTSISPDWPWGSIEIAMQRISTQLAGKLASWYNHSDSP